MRREIEATVQQLMQLLQESERQLMRELYQVTDAYVEKLSACKKEVDITIAQLRSCKEFAEEELVETPMSKPLNMTVLYISIVLATIATYVCLYSVCL